LNFVLIPDQIRDPGNLGTLLRSAAAAGVQAVFLPPETTDAFAPKVVRSGMGAHFRLPIKISIPMSGDIESLNAGVAGSVLMFEVMRQRSVGTLRGQQAVVRL
jgi:TrmH family RNA methyltransferase